MNMCVCVCVLVVIQWAVVCGLFAVRRGHSHEVTMNMKVTTICTTD